MADFVRDFVAYLKTRTDAPADFHAHAAMICLATALGNRVRTEGWSRWIYPNMWIVIIAPSGSGKSVPLDMAERIIRKAGLSDQVMPDEFSREALYEILKDQPARTMFMQEFAAFNSALDRSYMEGTREWLTKIYDVPDEDTRVLRAQAKTPNVLGAVRVTKIHKPTLNLFGASSPAWFSQSYNEEQLRGGFLARFLFCPSEEYTEHVRPPGGFDLTRETPLADHLRKVKELEGVFTFSLVEDEFDSWSASVRKKMRAEGLPEFAGIRARTPLLVKKAAILFAVGRDPETYDVFPEDLERAIAYVTESQKMAEAYLGYQMPRDRDDKETLRVLDLIKRNGRIARADLIVLAHISADKLTRIIRTLLESGRILEVTERPEGKKRTTTVYVFASFRGGERAV